MLKIKLAILLLIFIPLFASGADPEEKIKPTKVVKTTKTKTKKKAKVIKVEKPKLIAQFPPILPNYHIWQMKKGDRKAISTNWAFVVDGSNSTSRVVGTLLAGFNTVVSFPEDQLKFCTYLFSPAGYYKYRPWKKADMDGIEFARTNRWIRRNIGVNSYGNLAIRAALLQRQKKLTIIIISDGGFSENFSTIKKTVNTWQQWREDQGLGRAVIVSIGIENHLSRLSKPPYPKDTDAVCQSRMRQLEYKGGYFLVKRIPIIAPKR
jgi:hypothetical protein